MKTPSSPTPPSSPASSLPSSSDDFPEIPQQLSSDYSAMSPSSVPPVASSSLPLSSSLSSFSSPMAIASAEPISSTSCSSLPLMNSQNGCIPSNNGAVAGGSNSLSHNGMPETFPASLDNCPSSSKNRFHSVDDFHSSCSSNHFSSEVSSSNMDVDVPSFTSNTLESSSGDNEAGYLWVPDSSEGAAGPSLSHSSLHLGDSVSSLGIPSSSNWQQDGSGAMGETLVSRSTWQVNCSKTDIKAANASPHWSSDMFTLGAGASDVSSTGPPETDKLTDGNNSCSRWTLEDSCSRPGETSASTSSWSRDPVNSSVDVETSASSWCQESSEGAVGMSWQCDSPNSTIPGTNISPSPSSTTLGASLSPSPWPPPLSSTAHSGTIAGISSSTQHCFSNPNINSTSVPSGEINPPILSWRTRASSSPIRLTRVAPTTPPPRPPTPPCPATPPSGRPRGAHVQYPPSPRRSVSPQDRRQAGIQSPSTIRRSVSPPLRHHSRSTPPTPNRRSVSPPLRGRGLAQRLNSPRRSVSPVSLQQALAQPPPSPTGRHRLSPRPRSARTPSPRPPRPPNSTPEPSPAPSQHSPRPHLAKMRGR